VFGNQSIKQSINIIELNSIMQRANELEYSAE